MKTLALKFLFKCTIDFLWTQKKYTGLQNFCITSKNLILSNFCKNYFICGIYINIVYSDKLHCSYDEKHPTRSD